MKLKNITHELKHHAPFTGIATIGGILIVFLIVYLTNQNIVQFSEHSFEILHPTHVLFSAFATAAVFSKYTKKYFQSILIGIFGAILIGSLSDIIFPYLGALIFSLNPEFHLPIIEEPILILGVAILGSALGTTLKKSELPHLLHVLISVFASLFYLTAYTQNQNPLFFALSFIIVFIAVIIPCCVSDIIFPLIFIKNYKCKHCHK